MMRWIRRWIWCSHPTEALAYVTEEVGWSEACQACGYYVNQELWFWKKWGPLPF